MKLSLKTGFSFGLTSGIITTLGLIVGLQSGTHSKIAVIGAIITIAVADAFSDALGIHISQESLNNHSEKSIWESTFATFLSKFFFALTFIVPVLLFNLSTAVIISLCWGFLILGYFSLHIAREQNSNPKKVILQHLLIAFLVIFITHYLGLLVSSIFT